MWQAFNAGMGLPGNRPWDDFDPVVISLIIDMNNHFKKHFSYDSIMVKYSEAMIKIMKIGFRLK